MTKKLIHTVSCITMTSSIILMLFAIGGLDSDVLTVEQAASEAIVYIIMLIASYLISLVTAEACGDDFDR